MNTVTQTMQFRQSLLKYAEKYGVTKAAIKYNVNRQYIYRWKRRYNGDIQSLASAATVMKNSFRDTLKRFSMTTSSALVTPISHAI